MGLRATSANLRDHVADAVKGTLLNRPRAALALMGLILVAVGVGLYMGQIGGTYTPTALDAAGIFLLGVAAGIAVKGAIEDSRTNHIIKALQKDATVTSK